jgi:hypothetical protein
VQPLIQALESTDRWFAETSLETTVLALLLSFVLGQVIAWFYAWSHAGLSYSSSYTQSLVLMCVVVSLVMLVIGHSIVTAFGLLGALALIRFRNVLKDTRDTVFVFITLVIGMAVGAQRFMTAIIGTVALLLVVVYLKGTSFGSTGRYDGYLTCRLVTEPPGDGPDTQSELARLLHRFCRATKLMSTRETGEESEAELVFRVGLRDRERSNELLRELRHVRGVLHASLVMRSELSEI